jgi:hypothetical protein
MKAHLPRTGQADGASIVIVKILRMTRMKVTDSAVRGRFFLGEAGRNLADRLTIEAAKFLRLGLLNRGGTHNPTAKPSFSIEERWSRRKTDERRIHGVHLCWSHLK